MPRLTLVSHRFCWLTVLVFPAQNATADLTEQEKTEIKALIGEFISANPELIRDVLTELAVAEQAAREQAAFSLVRNEDGDPVIGPADAVVTIYEFSDYNCGYCKRIFADLQTVLSEQSDVKLVVKEFPILLKVCSGGKGRHCAQRQGKFPDFHCTMMSLAGPD